MNLKNAVIVIIIFSFITLSAVSAEDNITLADINVTYDEVMYEKNLTDISVELPDDSSGNFSIKVDDEVIYDEPITNKSFKVPLKLPEDKYDLVVARWPPADSKIYKISAFYNGIDLNLTAPLTVMKYPSNFTYFHFPEEIIKGSSEVYLFAFPLSATGDVEFYIDDKLINRTKAQTFYSFDKSLFNLNLGNHTFGVKYYGDSYYLSFNETFDFEMVNVLIDIPEEISIGHDDCVYVERLKKASGNIKVYIDGNLIYSESVSDKSFVLSLEDYIKYTNTEVTVVYTAKDFTRTKTQKVNVSYDFDVYMSGYFWDSENLIDIGLPHTLNNKFLSVSINGVEYPFTTSPYDGGNEVYINITGFDAGNYSMNIVYSGDDKYCFLNKTFNFTVDYIIKVPYFIAYGSAAKATLNLPKNATGNLEVYIDGKLFKSSKMINGHGEVPLGDLKPGRYSIRVLYNGSDYNVSSQNSYLIVNPKISFNWEIRQGSDEYITVEVPSECGGYVVFNIDNKHYKVNITNGTAKYSLKNLKAGEYDVFIDYYGDDGYEDLSNWVFLSVYKPKIKVLNAYLSYRSLNVKVKLVTSKGNAMAGKIVKIRFKGKVYKVKTNKKGIAVLTKKIKAKKVNLKITHDGVKVTKKLKRVPFTVNYKTKSKKVIFKVALSKKAENKVVKFNVKGKAYKVKTNAKGVAKAKLKKVKSGKYTVRYLKHTVKIAL